METIESRDGLALAAQVDEAPQGKAALVLCHPHPQMGGTMNAPLLKALVEHLTARGWHVLRFNFRGLEGSEGEFGEGEAEVSDALGALDAAAARWSELPLALAGWSFGAAVAARAAAEDERCRALVAIAPAVKAKPGVTAGVPEGLSYEIPALVICGVNDQQVDPAACREWAGSVGARYEEMKGANHFFWAKYDALAEMVGDFLDEGVAQP